MHHTYTFEGKVIILFVSSNQAIHKCPSVALILYYYLDCLYVPDEMLYAQVFNNEL